MIKEDHIKNISEPIAAASIAQVHFAEINVSGINKKVAIKILRPNITLIHSKINDDLFTMDFNYEGRVYIERENIEGESFLFNFKGYEPKIIKSQKAKTYSIVLMNRMKKYFVLENV